MSTRPQLTDAVESRILVWIRSGAFPHTAAAAEGIPLEVFEQWLAWGTRKSPPPRPRYRRFARQVEQAAAVGRVRAEIKILQKDPKLWLLSGPGRERLDCPGWTSATKPVARPGQRDINLFADPQLAGLLEALLAALAPFPDARRAAVQALEGQAATGNAADE
jgi:hypothetical protein